MTVRKDKALAELLARYEQSAVDAFLSISHSELSAVEQAANSWPDPAPAVRQEAR